VTIKSYVGPEDRVVRLRDGRLMGFAQYGDPNGFPIVNAHGGLAGRLDVMAAAPVASQAGVRLLSPDRPGIGLSDRLPGRTLLDWPRDVEEMADQLRLERFASMGWSTGGQFAAAVGFALAGRVTRVAIIAGALPLTEPGAFARLPTMDRVFTRLSQRAPLAARAVFRGMGAIALRMPGLWTRLSAAGLGRSDARVIRNEPPRNYALMTGEALRTAAGVVDDYRAWARPWGFAPEDITVPTDIWWGEDDELVPKAWAEELARRIPHASLSTRPGVGHFIAHEHYREIFDALLRSL